MKQYSSSFDVMPQAFLLGVNYHTSSSVQYFYKTTEIYLGFFRITIEKVERL